jgi:ribonuclease HI
MSNIIDVYTDGSGTIRGNHYFGSSSVLIYLNNEPIDEFAMFHENATNSYGELYAISSALDKVHQIIMDNPELSDAEVRIISDSGYIINSLNSYIYNWSRLGTWMTWFTSAGKPVKYQKIFKYIWTNYICNNKNKRIKNLKFYHTHGHVGIKHSIQKAYEHFREFNNVEISLDEYRNIVIKNGLADALAEECSRNKIYYYEVARGKWVKNTIQKRNGRVVIRSRNPRE